MMNPKMMTKVNKTPATNMAMPKVNPKPSTLPTIPLTTSRGDSRADNGAHGGSPSPSAVTNAQRRPEMQYMGVTKLPKTVNIGKGK